MKQCPLLGSFLMATRLVVALQPNPDGSTAARVTYTLTPTSEAGVAYLAAQFGEAEFLAMVTWWEQSMNHYLATGRVLRRST